MSADRCDEDGAGGRPKDGSLSPGYDVSADECGGDRIVGVATGEEEGRILARGSDEDACARREE